MKITDNPTQLENKPIYVASRASIPERGQMWRSFRDQGVRITSSWIDEDGDGQTGDFGELWERIANEIRAAGTLILYAEAGDFPLKGAFIEAGIALGMGKPVIVCLPDLGVLPRNYRPIGSWIAHPLVTRCDDINTAVRAAQRPALAMAYRPPSPYALNTAKITITDTREASAEPTASTVDSKHRRTGMTTDLNKETLEWAAQWIEGSLNGESNERVIEFAKNMAMTLRAAATPAPVEQERPACLKCGHNVGVERTLKRCKARIDGGEALCQCRCVFPATPAPVELLRPAPEGEMPELVKCEVADCNEPQRCFHYCQEHHRTICLAAPSPSLAAREAAEEIRKLCDDLAPDIPNDSTSYAPTVEQFAAIISRHCSPVTAAGGDEDGPRVDREVAAKIAFDTVKAALESENQYSPLQVAAMAARNIREIGESK